MMGYPPRQTAIAQSLHLLLAGCAGILKPVRPLSFPPLPELTSYGATGPVSPGNTAFTHWVDLLMTAPDLTPSCCQQIHQWYQMWLSEGGAYHSPGLADGDAESETVPVVIGKQF